MNTEPSWTQPWQPQLNWNTPAGQLLDRLATAQPESEVWTFGVFGSAPLQMAFDPSYDASHIDIVPFIDDITVLCDAAEALSTERLSLRIWSIISFQVPIGWEHRSYRTNRNRIRFIFPHPLDLLASRVTRLKPQDVADFKLVRKATGHPTEEELVRAFRLMLDVFRPDFDGTRDCAARSNLKSLWRELFNHEIDVHSEVILPELKERKARFNQGRGLKSLLSTL
jgi:hypothetical protein